MNVELWYFQSSKEAWSDEFEGKYLKKISRFCDFKLKAIKSKDFPRDKSSLKILEEEKQLFEKLDKGDHLVVFDEKGKAHQDSIQFSRQLVKWMESGKRRIVFVIGGAYGLSEKVKERSDQSISLSGLTMNHHLAKAVVLEQIYRGFSIVKGLPYHNS